MFCGAAPLNPLRPIGSPVTHENLPTNCPNFAASSRLACTQQTHCGMHTSIFSHTQMTTRAGSPSQERSRTSTKDNFQQFMNGCRPQGLTKWINALYSVHVIRNTAHQPSTQASYTAGRVGPNKENQLWQHKLQLDSQYHFLVGARWVLRHNQDNSRWWV